MFYRSRERNKSKLSDHDEKSRIVIINDETRTYEWKIPQKELFKSVTHVTINFKKKCYYFILYNKYHRSTGSING